MITQAQTIHLYDNTTGLYIKTFGSLAKLDTELGLYRGYAGDIIKGKVRSPKILISTIKADKYPGELPAAPLAKIKEEGKSMFSEEDIRKRHDMFFMILNFLKEIPSGKFIDEAGMLRQLSLYGKPRYREALSRPEILEYRGKADGTVYYGAINSIKKLKSEGVLS